MASSDPFLFVYTPRAGKWNHRFIVPKGTSVSERALASYAERAHQSLEGCDYLAAIRDVRQTSTGWPGKELLVLADVDTAALSPELRSQVRSSLSTLLSQDIEALVTREIRWDKEGKRDPVSRSELAKWLNEHLPDVKKFPAKTIHQHRRRGFAMAMGMALLLGTVTALLWSLLQTGRLSPGTAGDTRKELIDTTLAILSVPQADMVAARRELEEFLKYANGDGQRSAEAEQALQNVVNSTHQLALHDLLVQVIGKGKHQELPVSLWQRCLSPDTCPSVLSTIPRERLKELVDCRNGLRAVAGMPQAYTPFFTEDDLATLKRTLDDHVKQYRYVYTTLASSSNNASSPLVGCLPDSARPLTFLRNCYRPERMRDQFAQDLKNSKSTIGSGVEAAAKTVGQFRQKIDHALETCERVVNGLD